MARSALADLAVPLPSVPVYYPGHRSVAVWTLSVCDRRDLRVIPRLTFASGCDEPACLSVKLCCRADTCLVGCPAARLPAPAERWERREGTRVALPADSVLRPTGSQ